MAFEKLRDSVKRGEVPPYRATKIDQVYTNLNLIGKPLPPYDVMKVFSDEYLSEMVIGTENFVRFNAERLRSGSREPVSTIGVGIEGTMKEICTILGRGGITPEYAIQLGLTPRIENEEE